MSMPAGAPEIADLIGATSTGNNRGASWRLSVIVGSRARSVKTAAT
jgi:hypothetical protein